MLVKGALHIHSLASNDGELSLPRIADLYRSRGFQFICLAEHSDDMTEHKVAMSRQKAEHLTGADFCIVGGIEYSCRDKLHIVGVGCERSLTHRIQCARCATSVPREALRSSLIRAGFAGIVPPAWRLFSTQWKSGMSVTTASTCPARRPWDFFNRMKVLNPKLLAAVGDDLHGSGGFPSPGHSPVRALA